MKNFLRICFTLMIFCLAASGAEATLTNTWDVKSDFLTDNTGVAMESFENVTFNSNPTEFVTADFTVTSNNSSYYWWDNISTSLGITDGNQSIKLSIDSGESVFFNFKFNIATIGFHLWGAADVGGDPVVTFYDSLGNASVLVTGTQPGSNLVFFGATSDVGFSGFSVMMTGADGDGLFFDEVYYKAATVPVPSAMLLLTVGILGLAGVRRKKTA